MRLDILHSGYTRGTKILFAVIKLVSGYPLPDAAKIVFYRKEFYGRPMARLTQRIMRGPSSWSVADRELMAAYISRLNDCTFCVKAHGAIAARAYGDKGKVSAALNDMETAPIAAPLRAVLRMLGKLMREHTLEAGDMKNLLDAGVSYPQIEDALAVCFAFNTINRLADALDFDVPSPEAFEAAAKHLLKRGYQ